MNDSAFFPYVVYPKAPISSGSILNRRCGPELLRAVRRLASLHPGLALDLVGENRTEPRRALAALAAALGLHDRVRFSGFVEGGLADRYAAADVAIALSEYEGFGLPAMEACARGVPLVASRAPSLDAVMASADGRIDLAVWPTNQGAGQIDLWVVNLFSALLPVLDRGRDASVVNCAVGRFDLAGGRLTRDHRTGRLRR